MIQKFNIADVKSYSSDGSNSPKMFEAKGNLYVVDNVMNDVIFGELVGKVSVVSDSTNARIVETISDLYARRTSFKPKEAWVQVER